MDQWVENLLINGAGKLFIQIDIKLKHKFLKPLWKSICYHQIVKTGYCIIQKFKPLSNTPEKLLHIFIRAYVQECSQQSYM